MSSDTRRLSSRFGADPTAGLVGFGADPTAGLVANPKAVCRAATTRREPDDDGPDREAF